MHLLPDPVFVLPTDGIAINTVVGTSTGRIFMGGRDGCLYEVTYQVQCLLNCRVLRAVGLCRVCSKDEIMKEIYGPTRSDDGYWRIKTNQEINDILKGRNIIGFIKKQILNWLGHVECMVKDNNVQKMETHV